jgi:NhaP-type Na+/H+ or K+/H+ antiporter
MKDIIFYHTAVALAAGMVAQTLAARLAIPGIVLLLGAGVLLGPEVLGFLDPGVFSTGRGDLVSLAVTVILFEGGLALDVARLRQQQRSLVLLLTLGAAISMFFGTMGARLLLDVPWSIAVLYGTLMIVTGPTVVTPLLSRLTIDRRVRELLVSEGVLIDPIGAIVAIVAAEAIVGGHGAFASGYSILLPLGTGAVLGAASGLALAQILRREWIPPELTNPVVLGMVLLGAALASRISPEAGLMAAVVQGVVLGNARLRVLGRLREFKEALTVILLSFVFVVLAADLRVDSVASLGWPALGVVALLIWVGRPLAVFLATYGSELTMKQRVFVSWICPRGIVAAAVAGLFRVLLGQAGMEGGRELEALVFVTVAATVTLQGLTARPVARLLGVDVPSMIGTVVVGGDHFGRLLTKLLLSLGRQVVIIDRSPFMCRAARKERLPVFEGDALSVEVLEEAGARYADTVVAMTRNAELNELLAQRVKDAFRIQRVLALVHTDSTNGKENPAEQVFPGLFPGIDEVNRMIRFDRLRVVQYEVIDGEAVGSKLAGLAYGPPEFAMLLRRGEGTFVAVGDLEVATGDRLWCARPAKGTSPLVEAFRVVGEESPKRIGIEPEPDAQGQA